MAKLLLGKEVTAAMNARFAAQAARLREDGIQPKLAIVRVGADASDLAYEKSILARAEQIGVVVCVHALPRDVKKEALLAKIDEINQDNTVHGCLLFRPLPKHLAPDRDEIYNRLLPQKDVDGMCNLSVAGVFIGKPLGFSPCTPQACMELLDFYGIDCKAKRAVVIGRSMVVGKPLAMLLLARDATVTVCHSKTENLASIARQADILVCTAGVLGMITKDFVREGQVLIDVSVNWDEKKPNAKGGLGAIAGDAVFDEVAPIVDAITPVPGGVGGVTASVLIGNVVQAAVR